MQRYNVTLSDEEYKSLKTISENFNVPMSKIIKRFIRILAKSGMENAEDNIYVLGMTEKGAWMTDIRSGEDIQSLQGGMFELKQYRDRKSKKMKSKCDFSFFAEKRIYLE